MVRAVGAKGFTGSPVSVVFETALYVTRRSVASMAVSTHSAPIASWGMAEPWVRTPERCLRWMAGGHTKLTAMRRLAEQRSAKWRRGRVLIIRVTPIMSRVAMVAAATLAPVMTAHAVVMVMVVVLILGIGIGIGIGVGVRRIRMVTLSPAVLALAKLPSPFVFVHSFGNASPFKTSRTTRMAYSSVRRARMGP